MLVAQLRKVSQATWMMWLFVLVHATWMSWLAVDMYRGLGTFAYDVGLYDQGIWLLSRGHAPFVTLMGRNLFGDHASLILLFFVPIYWVVPGVPTLLVAQCVAIACGAVPMYLIARRLLGHDMWAVAVGVMWLVNPAVNGTNMENFHPDAFLGLFLPVALFALLEKKWRLYAVAVLLILLVKEDVLLVVVPLGIYVAVKEDKRKGLLTILTSLTATLLGMFVLMRGLTGVPTRNGWRVPFGGVGGFIRESFTNPTSVAKYLWSDDRPLYLFQMAAPFAGVFLGAPAFTLIAAPVIASNVISTFWYQHSIQYHYSLIAIPILLVGSVMAIAKLAARAQRIVLSVVLLCSLVTFVAWGQHPLAAHPREVLAGGTPVSVAGRDIIKRVPSDAVISVYDALTTHATHRKEIYFFPNPFNALYYGVDNSLEGRRLPAADRVEYVVLPRFMDPGLRKIWTALESGFEEVDSNDFWQVFKKK